MTDTNTLTTKKRYEFLDLLRGIMMVSVMTYHFLYDLVDILGISMPWFDTVGAWYWEQITAGTFIFLCGVCCNFSRNNVKRGVKLILWSLVISGVTLCLDLASDMFSGIFIRYGILTCLGCCSVLLGYFQEKVFDKVKPVIGTVINLALYLFTKGVAMPHKGVALTGAYRGFLGIERLPLVWLPEKLYTYQGLALFGLPSYEFNSADYFPLVPYLFLFLAGYYCWKLIKDTKVVDKVAHLSVKPLNFIGRQSIWFYLLHQPVFAVILGVVLLATGGLF